MKHFKILYRTIFVIFILTLTTYADSYAVVFKANVSSVHGNMIELDIGSEKGIRVGDVGRVYYTVKVGGMEKSIYIAKFKVTHLTEKSIMARIEERTGEVRVGFLAEIKVEERSIATPPSTGSILPPKTIDKSVKKEENIKGIEEKPIKNKGLLSIMSYPKGLVFINGKKIGYTPLQNMEIPVGRNEILVKINGDEQKKIVVVRENEPAEVIFQFGKSQK